MGFLFFFLIILYFHGYFVFCIVWLWLTCDSSNEKTQLAIQLCGWIMWIFTCPLGMLHSCPLSVTDETLVSTAWPLHIRTKPSYLWYEPINFWTITGANWTTSNPALTLHLGLVEPYPCLEICPYLHAERTDFLFHHWCCWAWQFLFDRRVSTSMWLYSKSSTWLQPLLQ